VGGIYRAVFYLLIVGFPEELVMRGYIYLRLKPINRVLAIIVSGVLFGVGHAILPGIVAGQSLLSIGISMLSEIGGGIFSGLLFISYMELSNNILVAILIHAILDYSYGYYGVLVSVITMGYLLYKHRFHKVENLDKLII
jgi:membrane protease YdiL (CAAX protease family)